MALNFPHRIPGTEFGQRYGTKRGQQKAYGFLSIECPKCHAQVGKRCWLSSGEYAVAHRVRRERFELIERQKVAPVG